MNPVRELSRARADARNLEERYYVLTSIIGVVGVLAGTGLMLLAAATLASVLGIDLDAPIRSEPRGHVWLGALLISIPLAIYLGVVAVAGLFSVAMVSLGKLTGSEAVRYALLSRYPRSWFRKQ